MTQFLLTHPDELCPKALNYLQNAVKINPLPDDPTLWEILEDVRNGDGEIYVVKSDQVIGAIYLEIHEDLINIALLGSDNIKSWKNELVKFIKSLLRKHKINHLSVLGRTGWHRIFKELKPIGMLYIAEDRGV